MGGGDPSDQRDKVQRVGQHRASADVVICLVDPAQYPDLVSIALHRPDIVWHGPSKYEQTPGVARLSRQVAANSGTVDISWAEC